MLWLQLQQKQKQFWGSNMKKHKGSALDFLPSLMALLAFLIIVFVTINVLKIVSFRQDIKAVVRGYILKIETVGYLTPESETLLKQELTDMGVTKVDLTGTTLSAQGYGSPVYLSVVCEVPTETLNMSAKGMLEYFFEKTTFSIEIKMKSTAKY